MQEADRWAEQTRLVFMRLDEPHPPRRCWTSCCQKKVPGIAKCFSHHRGPVVARVGLLVAGRGTKHEGGLRVTAEFDHRHYPKKIKVNDQEMKGINVPGEFAEPKGWLSFSSGGLYGDGSVGARAICEHFRFTGDVKWLRKMKPKLLNAAN